MSDDRDQMNVVIVGHVDHGKSTVVGRLLADTGALPQGKLDSVRRECERTGKPFEYAFLLDALSDEQDQGITIYTARCFFKSARRDYIIIDAPGHIEFLKNMISGAARAEAAVLVIDAKEGVRENIPTVSLYYDQGDGTRYRSLGCGPCQRPIQSVSKNVDDIIVELRSGKLKDVAERSGRLQDGKHGLEELRREGYM